MPMPDLDRCRKTFIGSEFLTWLFFAAQEINFGEVVEKVLGSKEPIAITVGKSISLIDEIGTKVRVTGNTTRADTLQAIRLGSTATSLALDAMIGQRLYSFTLGVDGGVSGASFPVPVDDEPAEGAEPAPKLGRAKLPLEDLLDVQAIMLDEVDVLIGAMQRSFLNLRLDPVRWTAEETRIRAALAEVTV